MFSRRIKGKSHNPFLVLQDASERHFYMSCGSALSEWFFLVMWAAGSENVTGLMKTRRDLWQNGWGHHTLKQRRMGALSSHSECQGMLHFSRPTSLSLVFATDHVFLALTTCVAYLSDSIGPHGIHVMCHQPYTWFVSPLIIFCSAVFFMLLHVPMRTIANLLWNKWITLTGRAKCESLSQVASQFHT